MAIVVPTILADNGADFADRLNKIKPFAKRIHIDITDGQFAPSKTLNLAQIYGLEGVEIDLHLMMNHPEQQLETIISLHPSLVIWHAEAAADHKRLLEELSQLKIKTGLGILPTTTILSLQTQLPSFDHALIFTGALGFNGGAMRLDCLPKIKAVKAIKSGIEVGVDGGINLQSAQLAVAAGADVLDSGAFIQSASEYHQLCQIAGQV